MAAVPTSQVPLQRLGVGSALPAVLADFGANAEAVFAEVGIELAEVHPGLRLEFPRLLHLLQRSAEVTGCEHLGLFCGLRFELKHQGMMGELMRTAPTILQALEDFVALQPGFSSGAIVYLHRIGPDHAFGYGIYTRTAPGAAVLYDVIVGVGVRLIQILGQNGVRPLEVCVSHANPADPAAYARLVRCPVRFDQDRTCLILDEAAVRARPPEADAAARKHWLTVARAGGNWAGASWESRVRHAIRRALLSGPPKLEAVSEGLGVNSRTLRRRLAREDTSFEALKDDVRMAVACELLTLTDLPVADVAPAVGLASAGVFSETFQRWTGVAPSVWRHRARGAGADWPLGLPGGGRDG